jgi:competence protein ComEC
LAQVTAALWVSGLLAWVLGVAGQLQQSALWPADVYMLLCALSLVLIGLIAIVFVIFWRRVLEQAWALRGLLLCWALALATLAWGSTGWRAAAWQARILPPELEGRSLQLTGQVAGLPQATALGWRFAFEPDAAHVLTEGQPSRLPPPCPHHPACC